MNPTAKNLTLKICITALFAALLSCGKMALAALPNVEVVTILVAVCAYVWGLSVAMPAVFCFIAVDIALWGFNTWVISYVIHWNAVALVFWALSKNKFRNKAVVVVLATVLAVCQTALFGVLTSAVDVLVGYTGKGFFWEGTNFLRRFAVMYTAGIYFYVVHVVCNAILFATAFWPLVYVNTRAKIKMFQSV